jgi:hypothetical protein
MLTYAHVCSRMLTYADVCIRTLYSEHPEWSVIDVTGRAGSFIHSCMHSFIHSCILSFIYETNKCTTGRAQEVTLPSYHSCYIPVLILLYVCVPTLLHMCLLLLDMCPDTGISGRSGGERGDHSRAAIYMFSYCYISVPTLLCTCPHTAIFVSACWSSGGERSNHSRADARQADACRGP